MRYYLLSNVFFFCFIGSFTADVSFAKDKDSAQQKEAVVATLTKEQISEFSEYVHSKDLRREEVIVSDRLLSEKQRELNGFMNEMLKEFGIESGKAYTFDRETKSLYLLSTNQVDKAGNPARTLVRKMKSDSESQYVSRLMIARRLTEQQIFVLREIREEKTKEYAMVDAKLRQIFKLEPQVPYRLDEKTGQIIRMAVPQSVNSATQAKDAATVGTDKKSAKKK